MSELVTDLAFTLRPCPIGASLIQMVSVCSCRFAAYISVCFASRVAGVWQGGSGLARTGLAPVVPGKQVGLMGLWLVRACVCPKSI